MATIEKRENKDGTFSYRLSIRKKGFPEIMKTFFTEEDAKLYEFYKERLMTNIKNFEVSIDQRITLRQVFEIKLQGSKNLALRSILDLENSFRWFDKILDSNKFVYDISDNDWEEASKKLYESDVFMGAKTEAGKRKMSISTLRRNFACASSAFSCVIDKGIKIENKPLKILQTIINPLLKNLKKEK